MEKTRVTDPNFPLGNFFIELQNNNTPFHDRCRMLNNKYIPTSYLKRILDKELDDSASKSPNSETMIENALKNQNVPKEYLNYDLYGLDLSEDRVNYHSFSVNNSFIFYSIANNKKTNPKLVEDLWFSCRSNSSRESFCAFVHPETANVSNKIIDSMMDTYLYQTIGFLLRYFAQNSDHNRIEEFSEKLYDIARNDMSFYIEHVDDYISPEEISKVRKSIKSLSDFVSHTTNLNEEFRQKVFEAHFYYLKSANQSNSWFAHNILLCMIRTETNVHRLQQTIRFLQENFPVQHQNYSYWVKEADFSPQIIDYLTLEFKKEIKALIVNNQKMDDIGNKYMIDAVVGSRYFIPSSYDYDLFGEHFLQSFSKNPNLDKSDIEKILKYVDAKIDKKSNKHNVIYVNLLLSGKCDDYTYDKIFLKVSEKSAVEAMAEYPSYKRLLQHNNKKIVLKAAKCASMIQQQTSEYQDLLSHPSAHVRSVAVEKVDTGYDLLMTDDSVIVGRKATMRVMSDFTR